jgi:hypothetical protein
MIKKYSEHVGMDSRLTDDEDVKRLVKAARFVIKHYDPCFSGPSAWDELKAALAPFVEVK